MVPTDLEPDRASASRWRRTLHAALGAALLAASSAPVIGAAGDVLVVDATGGGAFTTLQAAVDAAADGDTLLVKPGTYWGATVQSKGLAIVGDPAATVRGGLRFENTLLHHEVLIANLALRGEKLVGDPIGVPALTLSVVRGPVRIEDCELRGAHAPGGCSWPANPFGDCAGGVAVRVEFGLDVAFARCFLRGGDGSESLTGLDHNAGGHALLATGGSLALHDCTVRGGDGWDSEHFGYLDEGGHGGDGIRGADSGAVPLFVYLSGTLCEGGDGGDGDFCICRAGDGGDGVHLAGPTARLERLDSPLAGGSEGCGGNMPVPGLALRLEAGATDTAYTGGARSLTAPSVVREGAQVILVVDGQPGDSAVLFRAHSASFAPRPQWSAVLLLGSPSLQSWTPLGSLPGSGQLSRSITVGALPLGVDSALAYNQVLVRDAAGVVWLSGAWTELTLDASF